MFRKSIFLILLLAFGLTIGIASGQSTVVRINFQSRTTGSREVPVGYLPDYGDVFDDRGNSWSYGWDMDKTGSSRDRDSSRSPDQRYDTLNCITHYATGVGQWEIALPNNTYNVYIVGGDPGYTDQDDSYIVEGIEVIDPTPNTAGNYFDEFNVTVTVADGFLTVESLAGTEWPICKICFIHIVDVNVAQPIGPPDRDLWQSASALLTWTPGLNAAQHDVYLSTNFNDVDNASTSTPEIYKGQQDPNSYSASGLIPGTTYYWRIDEVNGIDVWKGDIWAFTVQLVTAYDPQPFDGEIFVDPNVVLSWSNGATVANHIVYFGDNYDSVRDATTASPEYKGTQNANGNSWDPPGSLSLDKTYYWRIDEKESGGTVHTGAVWSFTTATRTGGGVKGQYYDNTDLAGDPVLTRIDPKIDFDWGGDSPEPNIIPADGWSVRWIGELEIPAAGDWIFSTLADDGVRLWVDEKLLIDVWGNSRPLTWDSNSINLNTGFYHIVMEFFDVAFAHAAMAHLYWQGPLVPVRQVVPSGAFSPPLSASVPNPANGATEVKQTPTLRWTAGDKAAQHDVYFGDDEAAVASADISDTTGIYRGRQALEVTKYTPIEVPLEWNKTYYWRIDEVNNLNIWPGSVWSFTVADYLIVDDFEDYNDGTNLIYLTWTDGYGSPAQGIPGNGTGSTVGYTSPSYAETGIVHEDLQSMPMGYDNTDSPFYSQADRTWDTPQNWTENGIADLTLWFQGYRQYVGGISYNAGTGTYTMTGSGADIWDVTDPRETGFHDEFHFAYKQLSGEGEIIAKVESVQNTATSAKAGVMIRETLDKDSRHVMVVVTPEDGVKFEYRDEKGGESTSVSDANFSAPHWVRIKREQNTFTAYHSEDGKTWLDIGSADESWIDIPMSATTYIGLALTSHDALATCEALFSNVSVEAGVGSTITPDGPFDQSQDIGIFSNDAEKLYVILKDNDGNSHLVERPEPNATQIYEWQEWNIDLRDFSTEGVNLEAITQMSIGVGDPEATSPSGEGKIYIDDVTLYKPRCVPDFIKPAGDFSDNCIVDYPDLQIMADNWLISGDYDVTPIAPGGANLVAQYEFNGDFSDSANGYDGDANGASIITDPVRGQVASFDGTDDYVDLPIDSLISTLTNCTFATWVDFSNAGGEWQRIFDFGSDTTFYMFLSPRIEADGQMRFGITITSSTDEDMVDAPDTLASGWHHVAVAIDADNGIIRLYLDGLLVGENNATTLTPSDLGETTNNRLGRSQWEADAYFNGSLDDFRIYDRALSQGEIGYLAGMTAVYTQPLDVLLTPQDTSIDMNSDGTIDMKDYAELASIWLEEQLWPQL